MSALKRSMFTHNSKTHSPPCMKPQLSFPWAFTHAWLDYVGEELT